GVYSFLRAIVARAIAQADASPSLDGQGTDVPVAANLGSSSADWADRAYDDAGRLSDLLLGPPPSGQPATLNRDEGDQDIRRIGDKYLVVHLRTALLVVDQRAAHERIIYERTLSALKAGGGFSQQLLFPQTVELPATTFELARTLMPDLKRAGFDLDPFGGTTVVIRGVPAETGTASIETLLQDLLARYDDEFQRPGDTVGNSQHERLARSVARCSAVRANTRLDQREMRALVDQLLVCESADMAPDGRPTMIRIDESEFD